jgi:hypothetical protein
VLGAEEPQPGQDSRGRWHRSCCSSNGGAKGSSIQQHAGAVLRILAYSNDQLKITENGGIEVRVAAMKIHKTSVLVQEHACLSLSRLAAQVSLRQRIKTAGGMECVKQAVNASNATAGTKWWGKELLARQKSMRLGFGRGFLSFFLLSLYLSLSPAHTDKHAPAHPHTVSIALVE